MPHLRDEDRQMLADRFAETLVDDVRILLFTESEARSLLVLPGQPASGGGGNDFAKLTRELLTELADTSPKLFLDVLDVHGEGAAEAERLGIEQIPAIVLDSADGRVRFYGAPVGNEFPTILTGIESLSTSTPVLSDHVASAVRDRIDQDVRLKVFVTPT